MNPPTAEMRNVHFAYAREGSPAFVVEHLVIGAGETVILTGDSGSGKSTLLGLLCGVLAADSGSVAVAGHPLSGLSGPRRDRIRAEHIGYIFQEANLLPYLSPIENVMLAGQFSVRRRAAAGSTTAQRRASAEDLLGRLGIGDIERPSSALSVGQQQRVAAARAVYGEPSLLVADEPTAALDRGNRDRFFELLLGEAKRTGAAVLVVSHDTGIVDLFDRHVTLETVARWEER